MIVSYTLHKTDTAYLQGAPCISTTDDLEIKRTGYPVNEEETTRLIYAAAAEIRERRPRRLVGYVNGEARIPMGVRLTVSNPRQRR